MNDMNASLYGEGTFKSYKSKIPHFNAAFTCLGSFYFGIMLVYFQSVRDYYCGANTKDEQYLLHDFQGSLPSIGAVFGIIFISRYLCAKNVPRSKSLIVGSVIGIVGTSMVLGQFIWTRINDEQNCKSLNLPFFFIGRFIEGLSIGVFTVLCPLFIYELSPLENKIFLGGFFQLSIQLGIIFVKTMPNAEYTGIFVMTAVAIVSLIALIGLSLTFLKTQTPKYLFSVGKFEQARSLIQSIYKQECAREIYLDKQAEYNFQQRISQSSFFEAFNMKEVKTKCLILGIYVMILQQCSGINFLNLYQEPTKQGWQKYKILITLVIQFFGTVVFLFFNKCFKISKMSQRKFLIKIGTIFIFIIHLLLLTLFVFKLSDRVKRDMWNILIQANFGLNCAFMFIFGMTLGPVIWLYTPQIMQPAQLIISIACNWLFTNLTVWGTVSLKNSIPEYGQIISESFFVAILAIYLFFNRKGMLVETKNKTKLQIIRIINDTRISESVVSVCKKC